MLRPARRLEGMGESVIREMTRLALKHDACNLAQGFPDFAPPPALCEALAEVAAAGAAGHQYTITWGSAALRAAVAARAEAAWGRPIDPEREVTITCGVTEAIVAALLSLLDPGDEAVFFEPFHENYGPATRFAGGIARAVLLRPPDFTFDPAELRRAVGPRTRAIILNTPHNPTGRVFSRAELETVAGLVLEHGLVLITDEIYEHIVFDGRRHISPASLPELAECTIAIGGFGKTLSITGWRLAYAVAPPALSTGIRQVHDFLTICAPTPLQVAVTRALPELSAYQAGLARLYQDLRDRFLPPLRAAGFACSTPEGAYYVLADAAVLDAADDHAAALRLVQERGVAAVPGSSFYATAGGGRQQLRFAFCKRPATLQTALARLGGRG